MKIDNMKMNKVIIVAYIAIPLLAVIGYCMNLYKLMQCDFASPYKAEFLYILGMITGAGSFLGYFNFGI